MRNKLNVTGVTARAGRMADSVEEYLRELVYEERSLATIDKYRRDLRRFLGFVMDLRQGVVSAEGLGKEDVIAYKEYLRRNYAAVSANSMLAPVNGYLGFVGRQELRVKRLKVQRQSFIREEQEITKAEYVRLLVSARDKRRLKMIIETICATGIRISELPFFTAEAVRRGRVEICCKSKVRMIILPDKLRQKLLHYLRKKGIKKGPIFITKYGNPVNRSNIWGQMKKLCDAAKVSRDKVFPHNLRHLFARTYYERMGDLSSLADILGHSSMDTTRIYTRTTFREHGRQIASLGLIT